MLKVLALRALGIRLLIFKNNVCNLKTENYLITNVRTHAHIHTSTYGINNSVAQDNIIFTTILLKYFSTNSVAMMKYLAGVMALGIHHWSSNY